MRFAIWQGALKAPYPTLSMGIFRPVIGQTLEMVTQERAQGRLSDQLPMDTLQEMGIRIGITLDQHRPVRRQGDIPADDHPVQEGPVRPLGEIGDRLPVLDPPAGNLRSRDRMPIPPAIGGEMIIVSELTQDARLQIDPHGIFRGTLPARLELREDAQHGMGDDRIVVGV